MAYRNGKETKLTAEIRVYCDPRLKDAAGNIADEKGLALSELAAQAIAAFIGHPELGCIPRMRMGRPRKQVNGRHGGRK